MPQLPQRLSLNLADALARNREILAHFLQRVLAAILQPEPQPDDLLLARRKRLEHFRSLLVKVQIDDLLGGRQRRLVDEKIAQMRFVLFSHRRFERNRLLRDAHHPPDLMDRQFHLGGQFFAGRFPAQFLHQGARTANQLVDGLDHVDRNADRARLIGNGARDGLPHPPRRVSRELVTPPVLELFHRLHQPDIAFLNQVEELQPAIVVALGDAHHQPEIRFDQFLARGFRLAVRAVHQLQRAAQFRRRRPVPLLHFLHRRRQRTLLPAQFPDRFPGTRPRSFDRSLIARDPLFDGPNLIHSRTELADQTLHRVILQRDTTGPARNLHREPRHFPPHSAMLFGLRMTRNGHHPLLQLEESLPQLNQIVTRREQLARATLVGFVGGNRIVELQDVAHVDRACPHVLAEADGRLNDQRASRQNPACSRLAALNAARDADLALAVEKRHRTHFPQIKPYRIVRLVEGLDFDDFAGLSSNRRSSIRSSTRSSAGDASGIPSTSCGMSSITSSNSTKLFSLLTSANGSTASNLSSATGITPNSDLNLLIVPEFAAGF